MKGRVGQCPLPLRLGGALQADQPASVHVNDRRSNQGYIKGVAINRPAVISVNMFYAALAVNEFLARLHSYRTEPNGDSATFCVSLSGLFMVREPDSWLSSSARLLARGDVEPRLDMPSLSE